MPHLETEEEVAERIAKTSDKINNFDEMFKIKKMNLTKSLKTKKMN